MTDITAIPLKYDVIISTLSSPNKLLWKNQQHFTCINMSQDYGKGIRSVWWGKFWDAYLSSDQLDQKTALTQFDEETQIRQIGPIYNIDDYIQLTDIDRDIISVLIVPGNTGANTKFLKRLEEICTQLLQAGLRVVWKGNEEFFFSTETYQKNNQNNKLEIEPTGPLHHLENYHLVIGKGSYNQITESLIKGTPYAAVKFLGYWEKQNLCIQDEGAHVMDWSKKIIIPSKNEFRAMKSQQIKMRDKLFLNPEKINETLSKVIYKKEKTSVPVTTGLGPWYDISGSRVDLSNRNEPKKYLRTLIKKNIIRAIMFPIIACTGAVYFIKLRGKK